MNGIKVTYGNQTKRISEEVKTYECLTGLVMKIFSFRNEEKTLLRICYVDKDNEKIEVSTDEDFEQVVKYHNTNQKGSTIKLELYFKLKESFNLDEFMSNDNLSHSFAVIERKDFRKEEEDDKENKIVDFNNLMKLSRSTETQKIETLENASNTTFVRSEDKLTETHFYGEDKAIQNDLQIDVDNKFTETIEMEFIDQGISTKVEVMENATQIEHKFLKEEGCHTEEVLKIEESVQVDNNLETYENIKKDENKENLVTNTWHSAINISQVNNLKKTYLNSNNISNNEELLISKFEDILSSKMKEMEENFKRQLENQQQSSKIFQSAISNLNEDKQNEINKIPEVTDQINLEKYDYPSLQLNQSGKFFEEFCSNCNFQILRNKYCCILCEDFNLCSKCESIHLQHPLIKINIECQEGIKSKEEITKFLIQSKKVKKVGLLNEIKRLKNMFKTSPCNVTIYPVSEPTVFAMAEKSTKIYELQLNNQSKQKIGGVINVIAINNKQFKVSCNGVDGLNDNEIKTLNVTFESPESGVFEFELRPTMKNHQLAIQSLKFQIRVVKPESIDESNADILFDNYEDLLKLSSDKKVDIYKLIMDDIVKLEVDEIVKILRKHSWDVAAAFDELVPVEDEEPRECYYNPFVNDI